MSYLDHATASSAGLLGFVHLCCESTQYWTVPAIYSFTLFKGCIYVLFSQVAPAKGTYTLQVKVLTYVNPEHRDYEGACCDIAFSLKCGKCEADFRFCARSYGTAVTTDSCSISSTVYYTSDSIPDSSSIYFFNTQGEIYQGANVNNSLVFTGNSWPVSFAYIHQPSPI